MPTAPSRGRTLTVLALLLGLAAPVSSGCSLLGDHEDAAPSSVVAPADVVAALTVTLDQRAEAVRNHDTRGLLAGLAAGDRALRRQQRAYAVNLA
jgi:hypothetical protein